MRPQKEWVEGCIGLRLFRDPTGSMSSYMVVAYWVDDPHGPATWGYAPFAWLARRRAIAALAKMAQRN